MSDDVLTRIRRAIVTERVARALAPDFTIIIGPRKFEDIARTYGIPVLDPPLKAEDGWRFGGLPLQVDPDITDDRILLRYEVTA